ncbi:MAG: 30S ribosomal protein S16 [Deltaproteobacteria bacterium]|nr:30S ribosomal protein S16 [Deltaproteobacteria bacterium]
MVKIRLARFGSKKHPYYHIVVCDSESPRDGRFLEQLGTYDPSKPMSEARLERKRLEYWLGVGANATETLKKIIRENKKALTAAPNG